METDNPTPVDTNVASAVAEAVDWQAKYQSEVGFRQQERNLYRPAMQMLKDLSEDERAAVIGLTEAIRAGDYETVVNWSLATAENVSGRPVTELIAARQQSSGMAATADIGGSPQPAAPAQQQMPDIGALIAAAQEAARYEAQTTVRTQQFISDYTRQMADAGFSPASAEGQEIIRLAKAYDGDMGRAINVFRAEQSLQSQAAAAAAGVAGQIPSPAPSGAPMSATPASQLSPREKMMNRITASPTR